MKKNQYIAPTIEVTLLHVENLIAESPLLSEENAKQEDGMDVKRNNQGNSYNVWDDDWSK